MGHNLKMYLVCKGLKKHPLETHIKGEAEQKAAGVGGWWEGINCAGTQGILPAALKRTCPFNNYFYF